MPVVLSINDQPKRDRAVCPAGLTVGICVHVADLGTHTKEYKGEKKTKRLLHLGFETPNEKHIFSPERGEQPFYIHREFTLTMNEKGTLRPFLESWRGSKFTADQLARFEMQNLLGKPCMLNIVHAQSNGNTYANIGSITPLMKGLTAPAAEMKLVNFGLDDGVESEAFKALFPWLQAKILACEELKPANASAAQSNGDEAPAANEDAPVPF